MNSDLADNILFEMSICKKKSLRRFNELHVDKSYQACFEHKFDHFRHYFPDFK